MTPAELQSSALSDNQPAAALPLEAQALWHAKKGQWEAAHNIAQDIHTPMGSWIHALLHVIEGDQWNADYWFAKAGKPSRKPGEIDALWLEIATAVLK
ncbi:MAG TPA: hypothetical protein VD994_08985 [Prosthecobacter sp.]|nr:hypothetical protein [Prosthecobacter sp.]